MPEFEPLAERYSFSEIGHFTSQHPDPLRLPRTNLLLVGSAGSGKTMALRQLCRRLELDQTGIAVYPLYVMTENWISQPFSRTMGKAGHLQEHEATVRARGMLGLGITSRILELLGEQPARQMASVFAVQPAPGQDILEWADATMAKYTAPAAGVTEAMLALPELPELFGHFGRVVKRATGRRLLLLLDQLDAVAPAYMKFLATAIGRSEDYTLVIATRPSPTAPAANPVRLRTDSCEIQWIGTRWHDPEWPEFLQETAAQVFSDDVVQVIEPHAQSLAALVGPSVRNYLKIAERLRHELQVGKTPGTALSEAVSKMKSSYETELRGALEGYDDPVRFIRELQRHFSTFATQKGYEWPLTIQLRPSDDSLVLREQTIERVRVAVREGLFAPVEPERYGLDSADTDFRLVPFAAVRSVAPGDVIFPQRIEATIDEETFMNWGSKPKAFRRPEQVVKSEVFYSHRFGDDRSQVFLDEFRSRMMPYADITIGRGEKSGSLAQLIRGKIGSANLAVVQLDVFRHAIGLEIGWSAAMGKEVLLGNFTSEGVSDFPAWIREFELHLNNRDNIAGFCKKAVEILRSVEDDPDSSWLSEELDYPITKQVRKVTQMLVVGSGQLLKESTRILTQLTDEAGYERPKALDTGDDAVGARLTDVIVSSREAATMLAVMSDDRSANLLTHVGIGAHTWRASDELRSGELRVPRRALVVDVSRSSIPAASELIKSTHRSLVTQDLDRVCVEAFNQFDEIQRNASRRR